MKTKIFSLVLGSFVLSFVLACGGGGTLNKEGDSSGDDGSSNGNTHSSNRNYILTAWNDLGMHCMDGKDFSVFSILPPYNNLHAQLKKRDGGLVTSSVTITYEATQGTDGKINTTSATKTNFWSFSNKLFPNSNLANDVGLTGNKTPSTTPQKLSFNKSTRYWEAEGIPITPYNDDGSKNYYPLVLVKAIDSKGKLLASAKVVLPVSDEMDCKACHASGTTARPAGGWVNLSDKEKDYKYNILRLHDERMPNAVSSHLSSLKAKGYNYDPNGLESSAKKGEPILCAACHISNALPGSGVGTIKSLTSAIHGYHAHVRDPKTGLRLDDSKNRDSCYMCHPGSNTKCLRGAMGDAKDSSGKNMIQCQSCHGGMGNVGDPARVGWLDEPNCQACHQDGKRYTSAIDPMTNALRVALDSRFATNPNTPTQGHSLYRFSTGHGKLQCEACHGSPHAIYPAHKADNLLSISLQGHAGTIGECSSCHKSIPSTVNGGPHGMHTVGERWVGMHQDVAEHGDKTQCAYCHGSDFRGTSLSAMMSDRKMAGKTFKRGHQVSCYDCHNGPNGEDDDD